MMDAKTQTRMAADLGATGWWWAVQRRDGSGNVNRLEAVPWERVIADLLRLGYVPCWAPSEQLVSNPKMETEP